jgi:hypothetical protein
MKRSLIQNPVNGEDGGNVTGFHNLLVISLEVVTALALTNMKGLVVNLNS